MCTALTILTLSFWFVLEAGLVIEEAYQLYLTELDVPSDFRISMVVSWFPREEILRKSPRVVATGGLFLAVETEAVVLIMLGPPLAAIALIATCFLYFFV